ncbi:MAG TPA: LysM peptidoglycan-binding domain-containing protein [Microbacterium sp.]|nr:LysM peptidoglycan-binding domain-containing protein [Microbacterium sp.]
MTVTGEPTRSLPAEGDPAARPSRRRDGLAVREVCPFLVADEGTWRSAYAAREHRCGAVQPPAPLVVAKQRQLCLLAAHEGCATYLAARAVADDAAPSTPGDDGAALWQGTAPPPLVLEPARRMGALPTATARSGGSVALVGLMVVAFLVLVLARIQSPAGPGPTPGPSLAAAAVATVSPVGTPVAEPTGSAPSPIPAASATAPAATERPPEATAEPKRYRVKAGDTLISIAARYDTTAKKVMAANAISDPRALKVGQVLIIPAP